VDWIKLIGTVTLPYPTLPYPTLPYLHSHPQEERHDKEFDRQSFSGDVESLLGRRTNQLDRLITTHLFWAYSENHGQVRHVADIKITLGRFKGTVA
jgi:hypothetical protein